MENNPHEQILQLLITGGFLDPGKLKEARGIIGKCAHSGSLEEAAEEWMKKMEVSAGVHHSHYIKQAFLAGASHSFNKESFLKALIDGNPYVDTGGLHGRMWKDLCKKAAELLAQYSTLTAPADEPILKGELPEDLNDPFPTRDVLRILAKAAKYLLDKKNYDGPDHEEIFYCVKRAGEILSIKPAPADEIEGSISKAERWTLKEIQDFVNWCGFLAWYDNDTQLWNTHDESLDPFRYTTEEMMQEYISCDKDSEKFEVKHSKQ